MDGNESSKTITGYCNPLSLRAGETIRLMASSHRPGPAQLHLVRLICGDPTRSGPGFHEIDIPSDLPTQVDLSEQRLSPGSYGEIDLSGLSVSHRVRVELHLLPTRPDLVQTILSLLTPDGPVLTLALSNGQLVARVGQTELSIRPRPLQKQRWYHVTVDAALTEGGTITGTLTPQDTRSPAQDGFELPEPHTASAAIRGALTGALQRCRLAASLHGDHFDGRLARPRLTLDDTELVWDFSRDIPGRQLTDMSGHDRHGELYQLPARGVTGPDWNGDHQAWTAMPSHYDAIHFHSDDVYDAGWVTTAQMTIPADLPSGIYAFRLSAEHGEDRVPFFVRPAVGAPTADVACSCQRARIWPTRIIACSLKGQSLWQRGAACVPSTNTCVTTPKSGVPTTKNTPTAAA